MNPFSTCLTLSRHFRDIRLDTALAVARSHLNQPREAVVWLERERFDESRTEADVRWFTDRDSTLAEDSGLVTDEVADF